MPKIEVEFRFLIKIWEKVKVAGMIRGDKK